MVERLTQHIWFLPQDVNSYRPALGYVCSDRESAIIDTGNSPDHLSLFYGSFRSIGLPDPEYAILTHCHWDHVFGLSGTPAKAIATERTNACLMEMQRYDWTDAAMLARIEEGTETPFNMEMIKREMPMRHSFKVHTADVTYGERCRLRLNDIYCEMYHVGGPHSSDSAIVYIPEDKVLFVGDCCEEDVYHGENGSMQYSELDRVAKFLGSFDADWVVTGHGSPTRKDIFMQALEARLTIGKVLVGITDTKKALTAVKKLLGRTLNSNEELLVTRFVCANTLHA